MPLSNFMSLDILSEVMYAQVGLNDPIKFCTLNFMQKKRVTETLLKVP